MCIYIYICAIVYLQLELEAAVRRVLLEPLRDSLAHPGTGPGRVVVVLDADQRGESLIQRRRRRRREPDLDVGREGEDDRDEDREARDGNHPGDQLHSHRLAVPARVRGGIVAHGPPPLLRLLVEALEDLLQVGGAPLRPLTARTCALARARATRSARGPDEGAGRIPPGAAAEQDRPEGQACDRPAARPRSPVLYRKHWAHFLEPRGQGPHLPPNTLSLPPYRCL